MDKLEEIGYGAYGKTFSVVHNGEIYALKQNIKHKTIVGSSVLRELSTLLFLRGHPNIVELKEIHINNPCKDASSISFEDNIDDKIFFLFEIANFDLQTFIYVLGSPVRLILKILTDIALGLEYMHKRGIIHRDIKPGNILISLGNTIPFRKLTSLNKGSFKSILNDIDPMSITAKICDFGFSKRFLKDRRPVTPGVVTIWYRSPEILMKKEHDEKTDVWAYGLLIYEILYSKVLYETTGENEELELRQEIIRKRPKFDELDMKYMKISDKYVTCGVPPQRGNFVDLYTIDVNRKRKIETQVGGGDFDLIERLLKKTLSIDPSNRPSMTEILDDPIFDSLRDYIEKTRKNFTTENSIIPLNISSSKFRLLGYDYFEDVCERLMNDKIISSEIFFLAVDIFDRYVSTNSDVLSENTLYICVVSCLNISYKYYSSFIVKNIAKEVSKILHIVSDDILYNEVENMEYEIVSKLEYQIYHDTVYSFIDKSQRENVKEIFRFIKSLNPGSINPCDVADSIVVQ